MIPNKPAGVRHSHPPPPLQFWTVSSSQLQADTGKPHPVVGRILLASAVFQSPFNQTLGSSAVE